MDRDSLTRDAQQRLASADFLGAADVFRRLCTDYHVDATRQQQWLSGLARALSGLRRPRSEAHVLHLLGEYGRALSLVREVAPLDAARFLAQQGEYVAAGERYRSADRPCLGAMAFEQGGADEKARLCWLDARSALTGASTYDAALVHFNLGNCCLRLSDEAGHGHLVTAQRLLEEAADEFETAGLRERAFDCYQILLELGRRSGAFENLSEGYLNCIRILQEDGLKYYVLQFYEDFVKKSLEFKEFHAGATLYQEVADYCHRSGVVYENHYIALAASTWMRAADRHRAEDGAAELAENAYLAAVDCFNSVGDYHGVGQAYARMARLPLSDRKQKRYAGIAARYRGMPEPGRAGAALPEYLRQAHPYPDIWYQDLVELELGDDPAAVCASVLGSEEYPEVVRRKALDLLLEVLSRREGDPVGPPNSPAFLAEVARRLGDLQIYAALRPLEGLLSHPEPQVQTGVMRALRTLFFKRSFVSLRAGLGSDRAEVAAEARESLSRLYFKHAFDPLVRIFREFDDINVRVTALRSIGKIATLEAGDFLLEVLRHEPDPLRGEARDLLARFEGRDFWPVLQQHLQMEVDPRMRAELEGILQTRGM